MVPTILEQLTVAERLLIKGKLDEALRITRKLEESETLPKDELLECLILKGKILNELNQSEEALRLTAKILEKQLDLNRLLVIDTLLVKAEALSDLERFDESLEVIENCEQVHSKFFKEKSREITQKRAELLFIKSHIHLEKSEINQALKLQKQCSSLYTEIEDKFGIAKSFQSLGIIYWYKGEFLHALEYYQRSLSLSKEIGNNRGIAASLNNMAAIFGSQGEINQALDHFHKSLKLREEMGDTRSLATSDILNNIGILYLHKGELNLSLEYYEKSLTMREELGSSRKVAESLTNIGNLYMQKGNLDQAFNYLNQSFLLFEKAAHSRLMAHCLPNLVIIALEKNSFETANSYLKILEEINKLEENKIVSQQYRVAKAIVLKTSIRSRQRVEAEEILKQIVEEEIINYEISILAVLHLCELLLFELRITNDLDVLSEIQALITKMMDIAKQQQSHWLFAEAYVIQSKLQLLELDIQGAQRSLDLAQLYSEKKGFQRLRSKILKEKDKLQKEISIWEYYVEKDVPINERLDLVHLEGLIMGMARRRIEITEEDVLNYAQTAKKIMQQWLEM